MPQDRTVELPARATDERGRLIPLTEEQRRLRVEMAMKALDDILLMGDEEEQRATLQALIKAIDEEPLSDRKRFRQSLTSPNVEGEAG